MRHRAIVPWAASYPDPVRFSAGDALTLGQRDDEYPGWIWVTAPDGRSGWAPEQLIESGSEPARGLSDYDAVELDTEAGEWLLCHRTLNGWAWVENARGRCGWVPVRTLARASALPAEDGGSID